MVYYVDLGLNEAVGLDGNVLLDEVAAAVAVAAAIDAGGWALAC